MGFSVEDVDRNIDNPDEDDIPENLVHLYEVGNVDEAESECGDHSEMLLDENEDVTEIEKEEVDVSPKFWSWSMSREERW